MEHRPLIIQNGQIKELPTGGTVAGVVHVEPVVVSGFNANVIYEQDVPMVPSFVTMSDGDIVTSGA